MTFLICMAVVTVALYGLRHEYRSQRRTPLEPPVIDWETAYGWLEAARQEHVEGLPQRRDEAA